MRILTFPWNVHRGDNPYGELLYRSMSSRGVEVEYFSLWRAFSRRYDIFHLHWPEYYLNLSLPKAVVGTWLVLTATAWLRARRARIVWTIHNPRSHAYSYPRLERLFWWLFTGMVDGYVSLSRSCSEWVEQNAPGLRWTHGVQIPHGHYREAYSGPVSLEQARRVLDVSPEQSILLFFGGVSPYKNVLQLITAFRGVEGPNTVLVIAGRPGNVKHRREIEKAAGEDGRVRLDLRRIPRDEVSLLFASADLVVLPFRNIMHSGSAMLALSCNCPVLVPAQGALPELQARVGTDWVRTYDDDLTASTLTSAIAWARDSQRTPRPDLSSFDWNPIVQATVDLYSRLCASRLSLKQPCQQTAEAGREG